ncbi:MAG: ATP-binding protein [Cytophagaceae bacterium]
MKLSSKIFIGFFLIILLSIIGFFVNFKLSNEVNQNMEFLSHSEAVIRNSAKLHKGIIEMQSAFRGYLLTGNSSFLQPYYDGTNTIPELFKDQKELITPDSPQAIKLDSIYQMHLEWISYANSLINARLGVEAGASQEIYRNLFENKLQKQVGKKINDQITEKFRELDRQEYQVREKRRLALNHSIENTRRFTMVLATLVILIGFVSAIYITGIISKRIHSMVSLADKISKGNFERIEDSQNDELTNLSSSLNIMSESLQKSFTELERKNRELDQFAYVVSHDLKAPLRGIYNIFHWIHEDLSNEISGELKKYHEMMKGRVQRLESLITGLLEYARIGRVTNPMEKVKVKELLKEIGEMVVPRGFKYQLIEPLPDLKTEKIRLNQVFTNLISNAVKYHGSNEGTITVSCRELEEEYEFSVKDDGIGIAPEYHEKIFMIFQTLREKNEKESTGVGLAIVKKIIEDQKGSIRVISNTGEGATFIFTWPKKHKKEFVNFNKEVNAYESENNLVS